MHMGKSGNLGKKPSLSVHRGIWGSDSGWQACRASVSMQSSRQTTHTLLDPGQRPGSLVPPLYLAPAQPPCKFRCGHWAGPASYIIDPGLGLVAHPFLYLRCSGLCTKQGQTAWLHRKAYPCRVVGHTALRASTVKHWRQAEAGGE